MTKKMWDNSNMQEELEWGNIELPGLSDKELYKKDWNKVDAARQRSKDPKWIEANLRARELLKNNLKKKQEISLKISQKATGRKMSEETIEKAKITKKRNGHISSWNKGKSLSEETKEKLSLANLGKVIPKDVREKIRQGQLNLNEESKLKKALANKGKNKKTVKTPLGIFDSFESARLGHNLTQHSFRKLMKTQPDKYYYIK